MRWLVGALAAIFCATALAEALVFPAEAKATDLPREARATLALIKADGPFPYSKDSAMFDNQKELLP